MTKEQLIAYIEANLPNNTANEITPAILRDVLEEMTDIMFPSIGDGVKVWTSTSDVITGQYYFYDGQIWEALQDSGPGSGGAVEPGTDPAFWDTAVLSDFAELEFFDFRKFGVPGEQYIDFNLDGTEIFDDTVNGLFFTAVKFHFNERLKIENTAAGAKIMDSTEQSFISLDDTDIVIDAPNEMALKRDGDFVLSLSDQGIRLGNEQASGNYTKIEPDGTIRLEGDATVFNDTQVPPTVFRTDGTALTLAELVGGIYAHRFDVSDVVHFNVQFPHSMKLNSIIYPHLHVVNKSAITGTANVSFKFTYTWANINGNFPAVVDDTKIVSFEDADALSHKVLPFDGITPAAGQGGLSSILIGSLERVNTGYTTNNIFHMGFDIHYEIDTLGSREEFIK